MEGLYALQLIATRSGNGVFSATSWLDEELGGFNYVIASSARRTDASVWHEYGGCAVHAFAVSCLPSLVGWRMEGLFSDSACTERGAWIDFPLLLFYTFMYDLLPIAIFISERASERVSVHCISEVFTVYHFLDSNDLSMYDMMRWLGLHGREGKEYAAGLCFIYLLGYLMMDEVDTPSGKSEKHLGYHVLCHFSLCM